MHSIDSSSGYSFLCQSIFLLNLSGLILNFRCHHILSSKMHRLFLNNISIFLWTYWAAIIFSLFTSLDNSNDNCLYLLIVIGAFSSFRILTLLIIISLSNFGLYPGHWNNSCINFKFNQFLQKSALTFSVYAGN